MYDKKQTWRKGKKLLVMEKMSCDYVQKLELFYLILIKNMVIKLQCSNS